MKVAIIISAAGRGHRAGDGGPKQYRLLGGKSVLRRTIEAFLQNSKPPLIQCVIHPDDHDLYSHTITGLDILPPVIGGDTRQLSVENGLEALAKHEPDLVLIHDAARPFIKKQQIEMIIREAAEYGAVIPTLPLVDTIKQIKDDLVETTLDRASLARAQTPQAFKFKLIYMAHKRMAGQNLTDDCAIAEACGIQVKTIDGDPDNFKLTTAQDFAKAHILIKQRLTDIRTGLGYDVHRFEDGTEVILGGIAIPHTHKLKGHSDADVALHALTDALLGAIGDGDIGSHFPPTDPQWQDANSAVFLQHAARLIAQKEGLISHIDLTIICEAPKILPHRDRIRHNIAELLNLSPDRVSIKATTTEQLGFTGRKEGIAVQAIATIRLPE